MSRRISSAAGAMLLIGVGSLASPAFSQGPMAPRMDVAPPPRVAPPPPPVFVPPVVPTPPPMAPVMAPPPPPAPAPKTPTASAPAIPTPIPAPVAPAPTATPAPPPTTTASQAPRGPGGGPPPYTDSQVKALRGVRVGLRGPGGNRQLTSDSNGVVSLGKLGPGRHELTVNRKSLGTGTGPGTGTGTQPGGQPVALIGLLLPAVQGVRYVSTNIPPVNDPDEQVQIKVEVDAGGRVSRIDWGGGKASINVAAGDFNGDGRAELKQFEELAKRNTSGETRLVFVTPSLPADNPINGVSWYKEQPATATGPGGVMQVRSDSEGWTRFGKLPIGNTVIEFNGADLASALKASVGPDTPIPQKTLIELLVVIAIIAVKTDGTPVVFTGSVPASDVKTLKANLRIGGNGNAMAVDWGNGPQLPQVLPRTGTATLTVPGPNGSIPLDPALVTALQVNARNSAPGMIDANTALQEVSATQLGSSQGNAGSGGPVTPTAQEASISTTRSNIRQGSHGLAKIPNVGVTATGPGGVMQLQSDSEGVTSFGKLPIGTTRVEFNSENVATAFRSIEGSTPSTPGVPAGMRCRGCFLVPIIMLKADGAPVVSIWNGDALPNKLQALVRIGRDGNLMDVDWGSGPQPVQALTRVGAGTLSMTGTGGPVPVNPAVLKVLQDHANKMTPGMVDANTILMDVSPPR